MIFNEKEQFKMNVFSRGSWNFYLKCSFDQNSTSSYDFHNDLRAYCSPFKNLFIDVTSTLSTQIERIIHSCYNALWKIKSQTHLIIWTRSLLLYVGEKKYICLYILLIFALKRDFHWQTIVFSNCIHNSWYKRIDCFFESEVLCSFWLYFQLWLRCLMPCSFDIMYNMIILE